MKSLKRLALGVGLALAAVASVSPAFAQSSYPTRPIKLISPYEPGGGVDIIARLVAAQLSTRLNASVVVENRAGAGGVVGTQVLVNSAPDGYTLELASPSPISVAPYLMKHLSYDPLKDLAPVSLVAISPAIMVVNPSSPYKTVADVIAAAKANPGKLTYASSGVGGTAHLSGAMLGQMAHVDMVHVPYRGTGPALTSVLGGQSTMTFADVIAGLPMVKNGQMRAIAVTTPQRTSVLPDTPAIAETVPGYSSGVWYAVFAPAKTPRPIIDKLNKALVEMSKDPVFQQKIAGSIMVGSTPEQLTTFVKQDMDRWNKVITDAKIPKQE